MLLILSPLRLFLIRLLFLLSLTLTRFLFLRFLLFLPRLIILLSLLPTLFLVLLVLVFFFFVLQPVLNPRSYDGPEYFSLEASGRPKEEVECGVGSIATVIAGMAGGLASISKRRHGNENENDGQKVLILADSRAAIAAVKRAGRMGKARSRHLQESVNEVAEIREGGEGGG